MAAEEVLLNLFDSFWFEHEILSFKSPETTTSLQVDQPQEEEFQGHENQIQESRNGPPNFSSLPTINVRSMSDQFLDNKAISCSLFSGSSSFSSPHSVLSTTPKLQTILSGKVTEFSKQSAVKQEEVGWVQKRALKERKRSSRANRGGSSKSLSELEFDELKGFMDLGFVFTEEDNKDSELVSILPGLQRMGLSKSGDQDDEAENQRVNTDGTHDHNHHVVSRPYLSEAWDVLDQRNKEKQLMNWRVPADLGKDMKVHLRFWAHTVASTVK